MRRSILIPNEVAWEKGSGNMTNWSVRKRERLSQANESGSSQLQ